MPFIRMQLWLNDPANMDKLLAIKKLQEESRRRKRTFDESFSGKSSPSDISDLYRYILVLSIAQTEHFSWFLPLLYSLINLTFERKS